MLSLLGSLAIASDQLDIIGYYTQSAAIRAARGDSIATPAVSLEHGRGRLKDRSQGRRPAMRDRDSLESAAASNPDRPNPSTQEPGNPPHPLGPPGPPLIHVARPPVRHFGDRFHIILRSIFREGHEITFG